MSQNKDIMPNNNVSLSAIFKTDEDKTGTDVLAMSNFFGIMVEQLSDNLNSNNQWIDVENISSILGQITAAIKCGFDISNMGVMVADYSHFSQEIIDGIKKGEYQVGESKQVAGNFRPVIVNKKGSIIKHFTLKKAYNPSEALNDISSLSIQTMLLNISNEIRCLDQKIDYITNLERADKLKSNFKNAREYLFKADNNPEERAEYIKEAEKFLTTGLTNLYDDLDSEINRLSRSNINLINDLLRFFGKPIETIDDILNHISEDIILIPKYVAVLVYLYQCSGRYKDAERVINSYKVMLEKLTTKSLKKSKYSPAELLHEMYKYTDENRNFWLEMPQKTLPVLEDITKLFEQKDKDIYYIDSVMEEDENE